MESIDAIILHLCEIAQEEWLSEELLRRRTDSQMDWIESFVEQGVQ
ncbi:MAG: hypothetical protein ACXVDN_18925 [Ktedonobacteraceae bacterium]